MRILLVEDEVRVAKLLERFVREVWSSQLTRLHHCKSLGEANNFLSQHPIDLLFLDLNLQGQDGFGLLRKFTADSFHTVVVSAYKQRAIEAFEYGVLDFIPKPFNIERIQKTYGRLLGQRDPAQPSIRFVSIKKSGHILPIPVEKIRYVKADGHYSEIHLINKQMELSAHALDKLAILLPAEFLRIHRSYLANLREAKEIRKYPGSKYELILKDGTGLPIGRSRLKALEQKMI